MLPLSELTFCWAEELRAGAFAYLSEHADMPALIGTFDGRAWAVFLSDGPNHPNIAPVGDLRGLAISVPGTVIEIDPTLTGDYHLGADRAGCLCVRGNKLVFLATSGRGLLPVEIRELDHSMTGHVSRVFPRFRIVKRMGDDCHVLFEHSAPLVPL